MDYDRLWAIAEATRDKKRLSQEDRRYVIEDLPRQFSHYPDLRAPGRIRHPAGFSVSGAQARTLLRSALLLAARGAAGIDYHRESRFYGSIETDLALRIALSAFRHDDPRGAYCCPACTLAVLPLYECRAIHWFDCRELEGAVRTIVSSRAWRFAARIDARMVNWALR